MPAQVTRKNLVADGVINSKKIIGVIEMNYTLPDVKKELKAMYSVKKIGVHLEEFGEGFDTHVCVRYLDKHLNAGFESYVMAEEEKFTKADARGKRIAESLKKLGYEVEYEGLVG